MIPITEETTKEPALLRTCKKIRREASSIFQIENTFYVTVIGLQPYYPQLSHWATTVDYVLCFKYEWYWVDEWKILKKWLMDAFKHPKVPRLHVPSGYADADRWMTDMVTLVGRMFELLGELEEMRARLSFDLSFSMVDSALEAWRDDVAEMFGSPWSIGYQY